MRRSSWMRWVIGAAVVAPLMGAGGARWGEAISGETEVPFSRTGIVPLDLKVGPFAFNELLIQGPSSDPAELAALPAGETVKPEPTFACTNTSEREVQVAVTLTFFDESGGVILACNAEKSQDEATDNELQEMCSSNNRVPAARWAQVARVKVAAKLQVKVI